MEKHEIRDLIKETVFLATQSTKQENSNLVGDIKTQIALLQSHYKDIKIDLTEIKVQTTKINGSVINLKMWRSWMAGGMAIIVLLVLPLISYIFYEHIQKTNTEIETIKYDISKTL